VVRNSKLRRLNAGFVFEQEDGGKNMAINYAATPNLTPKR